VLLFARNIRNFDILNEKAYAEKKSILKGKTKSLSTFKSRIISQVEASPTAFANVLMDEDLYCNFRFETSSNSKVALHASAVEQEQNIKKQKLMDSLLL